MFNEKFKESFKRGGSNLIIFSIGFTLLTYIAGYLIMGSAVTSQLSTPFNTNKVNPSYLQLFTILQSLIITYLSSATYSSSNAIMEGNTISYSNFISNGFKSFWRTFGYSLGYGIAYILVIGIPVGIVMALINILTHGAINVLIVSSLIVSMLLSVLCTPVVTLKVVDKETKGFIKANWKHLLLLSLIIFVLSSIPYIGRLLSSAMSVIYTLFILSVCNQPITEEKEEEKHKLEHLMKV